MMPPTIAEREAELAALQSAFDEYITSSRELEEELDAELAKMQEKLGESSAANAALSSQLENIAPQLVSLEKALTDTRYKLEQEQTQRRLAEQAQDDAEAKCREMAGEFLKLKEDADAAHEELAFKESELEETRLELDVETERFRVELEEIQMDLEMTHRELEQIKEQQQQATEIGAGAGTVKEAKIDTREEDAFLASATREAEDDDYVKRLEDELELVTEQLIETEQRLTVAEDALASFKDSSAVSEDVALANAEREEEFLRLKEEHHANLEALQNVKEELELAQEELTLTQEELKAAEEDVQAFESKFDVLRTEHRDEVSKLKSSLEKAEMETRSVKREVEAIEGTLTKTAQDSEDLNKEVENLHTALDNAKADHLAALEELEELYKRFDEAKKEAEKAGYDKAAEQLKTTLTKENETQVASLKTEIAALQESCSQLQQKLDDTEMQLASANDAGQKVSDEQSETVQKLLTQLTRAKEELADKNAEIASLKDVLEERVGKAETQVAALEKELSTTKGKLYEAEAHLIVSTKREKTRAAAESNAAAGATTPKQEASPEQEQLIAELTKELDAAKEQIRMAEKHKKRLEEDVKSLQKQLFAGDAPVVASMSRLSQITTSNGGMDHDDNTASASIETIIQSRDVKKISDELRSLDKKAAMQRDHNAQLLSKILGLQGNIQVCCRVRPMRLQEIQDGAKNNVEALSETELGCFDARNSKWKSFSFDKVWGPDQNQQSIFADVEPLALSVVDGYNACIFAYGQTGSGKTYTMEGVPENNQHGISYRTINKIFTLLNLRKHQQRAASTMESGESKQFIFTLKLGMLEIYNDEIFDLLAPHSQAGSKADQREAAKKAGVKATLDIRRSADGKIEVPDLTKMEVHSIDDVMGLLKKGNQHRATAATNLNEHSSRSHMVLLVDVESGLEGEPSNKGILYLVDLAGSERVRKSKVEGDMLKEASHINKSLSALGNVMEALDRKASHVPYRDSKLTYLLQDSLGGNSRTMMVVAVCPADIAYDESVHALQFATRVRRIQIGAAQRNITSKNLEETIKALTTEMKQLSQAKEKSESQLTSLKRDNTRIQERLSTISQQRSQSQTENKTLEVLRKNNNDMAARWNKEKALRERTTEELEKSKTELRKKQTEVARLAREKEVVAQKLAENEAKLAQALKDVREAKDLSSAANLRARKAQIIGSRHNNGNSNSSINTPSSTPTRGARTPLKSAASRTAPTKSLKEGTAASSTTPPSKSIESPSADISEIRSQVLELLEKYDKAKVDRIDIIMDKFKGKENLLVDKMKQRYESGQPNSASATLQRRSEMALQRHKERMQKRLEEQKKASGN